LNPQKKMTQKTNNHLKKMVYLVRIRGSKQGEAMIYSHDNNGKIAYFPVIFIIKSAFL